MMTFLKAFHTAKQLPVSPQSLLPKRKLDKCVRQIWILPQLGHMQVQKYLDEAPRKTVIGDTWLSAKG